jgi:hypothetical protein
MEAFSTEFPTGNHILKVTPTEFSSGLQIPKVTFASDLTPSSLAIVNSIKKQHPLPPFCVLFHSGSNTTFIHKRCFPPAGATATVIPGKTGQTLASQLTTTHLVQLHKLILPEFSPSSRLIT